MKLPLVFAGIAMMTLGACTDMRGPASQAPSSQSGYAPIAFAPPLPRFCEDVAANDRLQAQMSGFDTQTINRIAMQSLQQCHALSTASANSYAPTLRVVSAAP